MAVVQRPSISQRFFRAARRSLEADEDDQLMNQMIFAFMQRGMSYRQAEEELFRRLKRKPLAKETEDVHRKDTKLSQSLWIRV
jgi:hypothetical protein